jgi:hypothetical protein
MRTSLLAAATIIAVGTACSAIAAPNLVVNGSFEDPAGQGAGTGLAGWTIGGTETQGYPPVAIFYNSASGYPTGAFNEAVPQNNAPTNSPDAVGLRAAYFVSDLASNQSLTQSVYLTAGTYQIGFSAYAPRNGYNNAGDATFQGIVASISLASYSVKGGLATTWQTFAGATDILADGFYDVQFVFNTNHVPAADVVIDQVYIIAGNPPIGVPEPGTLALLGLGLAGLGLARRRRA